MAPTQNQLLLGGALVAGGLLLASRASEDGGIFGGGGGLGSGGGGGFLGGIFGSGAGATNPPDSLTGDDANMLADDIPPATITPPTPPSFPNPPATTPPAGATGATGTTGTTGTSSTRAPDFITAPQASRSTNPVIAQAFQQMLDTPSLSGFLVAGSGDQLARNLSAAYSGFDAQVANSEVDAFGNRTETGLVYNPETYTGEVYARGSLEQTQRNASAAFAEADAAIVGSGVNAEPAILPDRDEITPRARAPRLTYSPSRRRRRSNRRTTSSSPARAATRTRPTPVLAGSTGSIAMETRMTAAPSTQVQRNQSARQAEDDALLFLI